MISLCIQVILSQTKFITKNKGNNKQVIYKNGYQLLYCIVIWKIEFGVNVKCDFNICMSFKKVAYVPRKKYHHPINYTIMVRWCFIIKLVIRIPYGKCEMMSSMSFTPHLLSLPLSRPTMLMSFKQTRISLILTWYVSKENYTWPNICHYI